MNPHTKKIIIAILIALAMAMAVNHLAGTTIVVNGKQLTGPGSYVASFLVLIFIAVALIVVIPSALILFAALAILFGIFAALFFPLLPIAFLLLPGVIFSGIVYLIYKASKKGK